MKPQSSETRLASGSCRNLARVSYVGWLLLILAPVLILGGAFRMQSNMITLGLLFLSLGLILARPNLRERLAQLGLASLLLVGAVYTFLT